MNSVAAPDARVQRLTAEPVAAFGATEPHAPEFFRLPKSGRRDPHFGLSRSAYYELEEAGAIQMRRLRKEGALRGITLVPYGAVSNYLWARATGARDSSVPTADAAGRPAVREAGVRK